MCENKPSAQSTEGTPQVPEPTPGQSAGMLMEQAPTNEQRARLMKLAVMAGTVACNDTNVRPWSYCGEGLKIWAGFCNSEITVEAEDLDIPGKFHLVLSTGERKAHFRNMPAECYHPGEWEKRLEAAHEQRQADVRKKAERALAEKRQQLAEIAKRFEPLEVRV